MRHELCTLLLHVTLSAGGITASLIIVSERFGQFCFLESFVSCTSIFFSSTSNSGTVPSVFNTAVRRLFLSDFIVLSLSLCIVLVFHPFP